jgi:predicted  nucleic acid-binding Zn-ribbon protein
VTKKKKNNVIAVNMNKCLNEFQKDSNKERNEIKKTIQNMNEESNKQEKNQIEILKTKTSLSRIKNSIQSLSSRLNKIKVNYPGLKTM